MKFRKWMYKDRMEMFLIALLKTIFFKSKVKKNHPKISLYRTNWYNPNISTEFDTGSILSLSHCQQREKNINWTHCREHFRREEKDGG